MKTLAKELTRKNFDLYGEFCNLLAPEEESLADNGIIRFWPDLLTIDLGNFACNTAAVGICQVSWRPFVTTETEFHRETMEGILPLDGDIYIHVAEQCSEENLDAELFEVFVVPKGTMVVLDPEVWHHAPFAVEEGKVVNTLILLPPETYKDDCYVVTGLNIPLFPEEDTYEPR